MPSKPEDLTILYPDNDRAWFVFGFVFLCHYKIHINTPVNLDVILVTSTEYFCITLILMKTAPSTNALLK